MYGCSNRDNSDKSSFSNKRKFYKIIKTFFLLLYSFAIVFYCIHLLLTYSLILSKNSFRTSSFIIRRKIAQNPSFIILIDFILSSSIIIFYKLASSKDIASL